MSGFLFTYKFSRLTDYDESKLFLQYRSQQNLISTINAVDVLRQEIKILIKEEKIFPGIGRMRCQEQSADGYIYFGVEEPGKIIELCRWSLWYCSFSRDLFL